MELLVSPTFPCHLAHRLFPTQRRESDSAPASVRCSVVGAFWTSTQKRFRPTTEEAGERLLRASQGVELIAVRLASKASQESLHSLGPSRSREHGRDQSKHRSVRLGVLRFYGHIGEDEAGRANEMATDRQSITSVPDLKPSRDYLGFQLPQWLT